MSASMQPVLKDELLARRQRLTKAIEAGGAQRQLSELLAEVDAALERVEEDRFGLCEVCGDPIEPERLLANPLERFCLGDLTPEQVRALEADLRLASEIQRVLLPSPELRLDGWELAYHYRPAGVVSGDYCDVVRLSGDEFLLVLGDVSGKGVAASMLMSQLHATFQALGAIGLPTCEIVAQASRIFCESTLPSHFATLVCARAKTTGEVELCNAGHLPALLVRADGVSDVEATSLPLGLFANEAFTARDLTLRKGDALLLFTDGLVESSDATGAEYELDRVRAVAYEHRALEAKGLLEACLADVERFRGGNAPSDDLTAMVLKRAAN